MLAIVFASMQAIAENKTKYEYDELNRLTKVTYSSGTIVTYTYDDLGNRKTKKVRGGYLRGDVNNDNQVNSSDIVDFILYLNNNPSASFQKKAADANADGEVNKDDTEAIADIIMTTP